MRLQDVHKVVFLEFAETHPHILVRRGYSIEKLWVRIYRKLNNLGGERGRVNEWKVSIGRWKSNVKKKVQERQELDDYDRRLYDLLQIQGVEVNPNLRSAQMNLPQSTETNQIRPNVNQTYPNVNQTHPNVDQPRPKVDQIDGPSTSAENLNTQEGESRENFNDVLREVNRLNNNINLGVLFDRISEMNEVLEANQFNGYEKIRFFLEFCNDIEGEI